MYYMLRGRFGNWLFESAAALAVDPDAIGIPEDLNVLHGMQKMSEVFSRIKIADFTVRKDMPVYKVDSFQYTPLPAQRVLGNKIYQSYCQSEKYFLDKAAYIHDLFRPSERKKIELLKLAQNWIGIPSVTAIHVRRGDYLSFQYRHPFVGKKYFIDAIDRMPECSTFVVFSDDIKWCKNFFPRQFPRKVFYFSEGASAIDDFYLMSMCKNNIISNSTFSWWSAWLNENKDKRVLAPSLWFGFSVKEGPQYWKDIYTDNMEIIQNRYEPLMYARGLISLMGRMIRYKLYPIKKKMLENLKGAL